MSERFEMNLLRVRIFELVEKHGSYRATARVLGVEQSYLWRLARGEKKVADDNLCKRLGLKKVVVYVPDETATWPEVREARA